MTIKDQFISLVRSNADECVGLIEKKNADYAQEDVDPFSNFRKAAVVAGITPEQGIIFLIGIKLARVANLLQSGREPNNESINDTNRDGMNYFNILDGFHELRDQLPPVDGVLEGPVELTEDMEVPPAEETQADRWDTAEKKLRKFLGLS